MGLGLGLGLGLVTDLEVGKTRGQLGRAVGEARLLAGGHALPRHLVRVRVRVRVRVGVRVRVRVRVGVRVRVRVRLPRDHLDHAFEFDLDHARVPGSK